MLSISGKSGSSAAIILCTKKMMMIARAFSRSRRPVLLISDKTHLGIPGETVKVKPGYARNWLIPKGHAVWYTWENKEKFANIIDEETLHDVR
jgi:hypothetical protein